MAKTIVSIRKEKNIVIFDCGEDGIVNYDLNAKAFIGKKGNPIKSKVAFNWDNFTNNKVDNKSDIIKMSLYRIPKYYSNIEKLSVLLKNINQLEGYFSANITNLIPVDFYEIIPFNEINKDYFKHCIKNKQVITTQGQSNFLKQQKISELKLHFNSIEEENEFFSLIIKYQEFNNKDILYIYNLYNIQHLKAITVIGTVISYYKSYIKYIQDIQSIDNTFDFPKYPKNFLISYDKVKGIYKDYQNTIINKNIKKQQENLPIISTENYTTTIPFTTKELVEEGEKQHHCVGGYSNGIAEGRSKVIFIRNKNDISKPYITLSYYLTNHKYCLEYVNLAFNNKVNLNDNPEIKEIVDKYYQLLNGISEN